MNQSGKSEERKRTVKRALPDSIVDLVKWTLAPAPMKQLR